MSATLTDPSGLTRVLLIEDNPSDAELFRLVLARAPVGKFQIESLDRIADAVARLGSAEVDVIVLDLALPDSFGIETLQTMRQAAPQLPIVVLTERDDEQLAFHLMNHGAQDYLVKGEVDGRSMARSLLYAIERLRFQEQLYRRDKLLAEAQQIARLGSFEWDIDKDEVTWSDELYRLHDVAKADLRPDYQGCLDQIHPEDRERVDGAVKSALKHGVALNVEYRTRNTQLVLQTRGHLVVNALKQPIRIAGTTQDVTERKQMEEKLLLAGRMSSVGTLASGVAHEINNPLTCVMANLEMIGQELPELASVADPKRLSDLLDIVAQAQQGADRVRRIVRGLNTFSRSDAENRVRLELQPMLELSLNMTFNQIRQRARLVKEYGPTPLVEGDEARLSQVFVNLLVNAAQAIGDGRAEENEIGIHTWTDAVGQAVIEIHDTGCGIPQHDRDRLFDPFYTTKPVGVGTGLGLSISHSIVTAHGGEIAFESTEGRGTRFRVVLPAAQAGPTAPSVSEPEPPGPLRSPAEPPVTQRRGNVLIVDDDAMVSSLLRRFLALEHTVVVAENGRAALDRLEAGERFDVILCDLMMPTMNGPELYEQLARSLPHQADRMIFVTGGAFTAETRTFLERVPNRKVDKPFDLKLICRLVHDMVDQSQRPPEAFRSG